MSDTWIVQWYSRRDVGEPDRPMGRIEFDNEADARRAYHSPTTQDRVGGFWRVELQRQPAPVTVEATRYLEVAS